MYVFDRSPSSSFLQIHGAVMRDSPPPSYRKPVKSGGDRGVQDSDKPQRPTHDNTAEEGEKLHRPDHGNKSDDEIVAQDNEEPITPTHGNTSPQQCDSVLLSDKDTPAPSRNSGTNVSTITDNDKKVRSVVELNVNSECVVDKSGPSDDEQLLLSQQKRKQSLELIHRQTTLHDDDVQVSTLSLVTFRASDIISVMLGFISLLFVVISII